MCGIAGIMQMGEEPLHLIQIQQLTLRNQNRGTDATGVAFQYADGSIFVCKRDVPAQAFLVSQEFKDFAKEHLPHTKVALVHTRWWTKGTPRKNENNHPLYTNGAAIVHNGTVSNDDFLFGDLKLKREAETDSDIIRAIVDKWGFEHKAIRALGRMCGSAAAACLHPSYPKTVLLLRSGAPLVVGHTPLYLAWSSEKNAVRQALRPWSIRFGFLAQVPFAMGEAYVGFQKDTAKLVISPQGVEWSQDCKISMMDTQKKEYKAHERFREQSLRADEAAKPATVVVDSGPVTAKGAEHVICKNPGCNRVVSLEPHQRNIPLNRLWHKHPDCGWWLDGYKRASVGDSMPGGVL